MNEIPSKFRSEAFIKYAAIVTVMGLAAFWLASCSPFPGEKPSVGDGGGTPTLPLPNTETPTATATSTETPTATPINTPDQLAAMNNAENVKYDAAGLHISLENGEVMTIERDKLEKMVTYGQDNVIQIRDEANENVLYAYDKESNTFLEASKYIQTDKKKLDGYIVVENWDELKAVWAKEKLFLIPFDPEKTYFPPLDKIKRDYENWNNPEWTSEYNYSTPFGSLPQGMESPFRPANYIIMREIDDKGKAIINYVISEQVYNPADKSFSTLHFMRGTYNALIVDIQAGLSNDTFMLPFLSLDQQRLAHPALKSLVQYLKANNLVDNNGTMSQIKKLVLQWFDEGLVPDELENIPLDFMSAYLQTIQ